MELLAQIAFMADRPLEPVERRILNNLSVIEQILGTLGLKFVVVKDDLQRDPLPPRDEDPIDHDPRS